MQLFLIRHAQSQNNANPPHRRVEDPGLTALGFDQAERLAEWIPGLELTRIISSPFRRSLLTAAAIGGRLGMAVEVRRDLHEIGGCYSGYADGEILGRPGLTRMGIEREFPGFRVAAEIDGDGWWACRPRETEAEAVVRAGRLLQQTITEFGSTEERIAYVMHADFKLCLLERFHTAPLATPWNTSVSEVEIMPAASRLVQYNLVEHLAESMVTL